jgi:hypothetical protein
MVGVSGCLPDRQDALLNPATFSRRDDMAIEKQWTDKEGWFETTEDEFIRHTEDSGYFKRAPLYRH